MSFSTGDKVRYLFDNSIGVITGKTQGVRYQVKFETNKNVYIPESKLELVNDSIDMFDLFQEGKFQGIDDFRRILYTYRLSGELTNMLYSMNNASTEFMSHQFIPVTKFLESYTNRLLIADEVGLGKTIEAMYIWEELRMRNNAKRLLIVVPAVLRYKWKEDLKRFFDIDAHIIVAQNTTHGETLLEHIENTMKSPQKEQFSLIISLEGIRISEKVKNVLEENADIRKIFDLVIIDEAHYLRNSSTASFKTGSRLRDVSENMLLLSATPIQTGSNNFYNLLNLLAPEDFSNQFTFETQLSDNVPLVQLTNMLDAAPTKKGLQPLIDAVLQNDIFKNDHDIIYLKEHCDEIISDIKLRIKMIDKLKNKYFYSNFVTRERKRDVIENRTEREAHVIKFTLSTEEKAFYDRVSDFLRSKNNENDSLSIFRLIARQRQMASCMPAALHSWRTDTKTLKSNKAEDEIMSDEEESIMTDISVETNEYTVQFSMPTFDDINLKKLEDGDSKFNAFLKALQDLLKDNPNEKIVVFSFFRQTVLYIFNRLEKNGISATYIMGGMSGDEKNTQIKKFQDSHINVLVSSEVGSEGIDLQFARIEINYDLPWNPMRLEQRIGRIDRIGQESPKIYICNVFCNNTIEDKILEKLYTRIEVFKNSIGDIEEILGKEIQDLEIDVFNSSHLTDEEIERKAEQVQKAILNKQQINKNLEMEAGNISAYQNFILHNIQKANDNVRYVTPDELIFITKDFLDKKFPGSYVKPTKKQYCASILLSQDARFSISEFIRLSPQTIANTRLGYEKQETLCNFNKANSKEISRGYHEDIDINHPLIKWILNSLKAESIYTNGCSAIQIEKKFLREQKIQTGLYTYYIQQWLSNGIKNISEIHYFLMNNKTKEIFPADDAEQILTYSLLYGSSTNVNRISNSEFENSLTALEAIYEKAWEFFDMFESEQVSQNKNLITEQRKYIERTAIAKINKIEKIIAEHNNDSRIEKMNRGRINKIESDKNIQIQRLESKLDCTPRVSDVAIGILNIL